MAKVKLQRSAIAPIDAPYDIVLTIKASDIKTAQRRKNDCCAAANALCRQEHFKQAKVFKTKTFVLQKDGTWLRFVTPHSLYTELMIFDRGGRMEEGDYILRAPKGSEKLGAHAKPRGKGGKTGKMPRQMHMVENVRADAPRGRGAYATMFG